MESVMSKNGYIYPIKIGRHVRVTEKDSPAHRGRLQYAIDFIAPEGTPVLAAADGVVVDVLVSSDIGGQGEEFDRLGNYIEVRHEHDEYSIYEHLRQNGSLVIVGERVVRGQHIGYSGATGWIAHLGPHLHFDVHKYTGEGADDYVTLGITWARKQDPQSPGG